MKTPDKIYIREYPDGIARFWESKKKEDVVATIPHEYINKDALLEWAKETYLSENASAIRKVCFKQLVEKLISM